MNLAIWEKVPDDLQKIITTACRKGGFYMMEWLQRTDPLTSKSLIDRGGATYDLPPEEAGRWTEALKPVLETWIADMRAKGQPVDELMNIVREEMKKRNVPFPY
jgi:TRAP-type C4-dicarboxylate transport system substrate-binding protein